MIPDAQPLPGPEDPSPDPDSLDPLPPRPRSAGSKLFLYILLIEMLLVSSCLASYLILFIRNRQTAPGEPLTASHSNYRFLSRNYRILGEFSRLPIQVLPDQGEDVGGAGNVEIGPPFIRDILKLKAAALDLKENGVKNAPLIGETLLNVGFNPQASPYQNAFILRKKNRLQLDYLFTVKKYREFIALYEKNPGSFNTLALKISLIDSLAKTRKPEPAFELFKEQFARNRLKPFEDILPRQTLDGFLRRPDNDFWFKKFKYLADNNQYSEFNIEKKYIRSPQLIDLFQAEFSYRQKKYDLCRRFLTRVSNETLLPYKNRILLKLSVRGKNYTPDSLVGQLVGVQGDAEIYHGVLWDVANIFLIDGEPGMAREFFSRYVRFEGVLQYIVMVRMQALNPLALPHPGPNYWKALWVCAWLHYHQGNKNQAADYFRLGLHSPVLAYRVANLYWLQKPDRNVSLPYSLDDYPFTYYYTRDKQPQDRRHGEKGLESFIQLLNHPPGFNSDRIIADLRELVRYGLWEEAADFIRGVLPDPKLSPGDKHTLMLIESVLYLRQQNEARAFLCFRDHFKKYETFRLPRFLSGIVLPVKYRSLIDEYCEEYKLDRYLILSLIREESFFRPDAVSPANAYGLMQLLLNTARGVALAHEKKISREDLFNPRINIQLGMEYFKMLMDKYKGKVHLALAAYNAGDYRVDTWLSRFGNLEDEAFIEMIPFTATRTYVKNILRNYYYYQFYYGERSATAAD